MAWRQTAGMPPLPFATPATSNGRLTQHERHEEQEARHLGPTMRPHDAGAAERAARRPTMRLVVAIVHEDDARGAVDGLTEAGFRVTRLTTSGGFLRRGNATLLIGTEAGRVPEAVRLVGCACETRTEYYVPTAMEALPGAVLMAPFEVQVGGATIFIMDVQHYERL